MRWASHEKPAIFYSIVIGSIGPVMLVTVPPIRKRLGDGPRERIPLTYPGKFFKDYLMLEQCGELVDCKAWGILTVKDILIG